MREQRISAVEVIAVRGPRPPRLPGPVQVQIKPLYRYPEHRPPARRPADPASEPDWKQSLYLRIATDSGAEGLYGPIDREAAWPIVDMLAGFLVGLDPLAGAIVWDKLQRYDRHARHGYLKIAISAVDNALWDLRGKVFDAPVWQLLGGPSRASIPAYASTLGTSLDPEEAESFARQTAKDGFAGQKWFMAHGPGDGPDGMERDIEVAERVRGALGPGAMLMFDAFMGWDLAYATTFARAVEHLRPAWLEEPFPASAHASFAELHRRTTVPLSAGEHLYDRDDALPFLRDGLLGVLQTDPEWCGGVTELVRICALAETFGVPVIPHGHGLHAALHVIASQSPGVCPMAEYLLRAMPERHHFEVSPPTPADGHFALPRRPGFGIELDDVKIDSRRVWHPEG
ncbi:MAG TPA: enolase C-terminal domain-like protein [Trebonia sp.]|jgi:L-rhamnonate dehydratase|nr:enolase C-terminal domain-like protein [Trebonia sp.]